MAPPELATLRDGTEIELLPLAREICAAYRAEYPDEDERYGDAGVAWCIHDNQHILQWAFLAAQYDANDLLFDQIRWLAGVLAARDFPLDRLSRDLEIAADAVRGSVAGADDVAAALLDARAHVRATPPA